jgi:anion-transporting  ArsA/GET3 family ATPase
MIINDTVKAADLFAKFDVPMSGYIVNRVLPAELKNQNIPEYLKNRLAMQDHYLKIVDEVFTGQILAQVPEMERDVTGLEMIEKLSQKCVLLKKEKKNKESHYGPDHEKYDSIYKRTPESEVHLFWR